ncbi:MAG: hypothetical protein WC935_03275 [Thermoleophilia bacterium]
MCRKRGSALTEEVERFLIKILGFFAKALYHEYPVYDSSGRLVGVEWHAGSDGRVFRDLVDDVQEGVTSSASCDPLRCPGPTPDVLHRS